MIISVAAWNTKKKKKFCYAFMLVVRFLICTKTRVNIKYFMSAYIAFLGRIIQIFVIKFVKNL